MMMSRGCLSVILSLSALLLIIGDARAQTDLIPENTLERLGVQRYWGLGLTLDAGESVSRIKLLDVLLVLVVAGCIAGPLAHMTVKRLFKGARERREAEAKATATAAVVGSPDDRPARDGSST